MSAFIVSKRHIDAILSAGLLDAARGSPLRWFAPAEREHADTYQRGEPWGPGAIEASLERGRVLDHGTAGRVGAMLLAENFASVNHRYDENNTEEPYLFTPYMGKPVLTPVVILKAISCYEYQSCEHPEWKTSEAHAFCAALRKATIRRLPGYDNAAGWSID